MPSQLSFFERSLDAARVAKLTASNLPLYS
jgi:hypothetical protein